MKIVCVGHATYDITLPTNAYPIENNKYRIANQYIITVLNRDLLKKEVKKVTVSQEKIVKVARVTLNDSGIVFPLVGRINDNRSVIITPEVKGRVYKVLVNSTQVVKEGDIFGKWKILYSS